ncbi:MAG: diguanylate cyclase, partial [Cellulomonadaceae bacterium]|nr:diguanylate cyclase [Cellulomonadaceae bacterium]
MLEKDLRDIDIFGRWGGEEFLCILPNTEIPAAAYCAERLGGRNRPSDFSPDELARLFHKLPPLDPRVQTEIEHSFERLVNKLLHPPLESLRDEAA